MIDPNDPGTIDIEQLVTPGIAVMDSGRGPTWQAMRRAHAGRRAQAGASPPPLKFRSFLTWWRP